MSFTQATPARPIPGEFLNTPAVSSRFAAQGDPVRKRLFQDPLPASHGQVIPAGAPGTRSFDAPMGGSQALQPGGEPSQAGPPKSPLEKAAGYVNGALECDGKFPDLETYLSKMSSDYEVPPTDSALAPFQKTQMYEIPQAIFEKYNMAEVSTEMGLFAELNHAWVTIDKDLYLWDYTHPNPDLIGYESDDHSITAIHLAVPKPGIFVKDVTHMLVVATTSDIFILGLSAQTTPSGAKSVTLYHTRTNLNINIRGIDANMIAASSNGRIFFAGQSDADIYEFYYQQEEKWFSARSYKINHTSPSYIPLIPKTSMLWGTKVNERILQMAVDDSRNLVYTLSNNSTIRTYHMEAPDKLTKVIEKTKTDCLRDILHAIRQSQLLTDRMEIVSICPISATEDAKVHLMAVTNTGCRLFMSAAGSYTADLTPQQAPQSMQLHSIKFPPPDGSSRQQYGQRDVFGADMNSRSLLTTRKGVRFAPGYFMAFVTKGNSASDVLFISTPDAGRIKKIRDAQDIPNLKLYEQGNWIDIGSKAEDVGLITKPFAATGGPIGFGNEMAVQFDDPASEFAILTNTGIHIIRRRRLVDIFAAAIRATSGEDGLKTEVQRFTSVYGKVETITAALAVACGQGNDQKLGMGRGALDQTTEDKARQVFVNYGGSPTLPEQDVQAPTAESVKPSSRHAALSRYLSRLVRTLWKLPVVSFGTDATGGLAISSTVAINKLASVQESVERLKSFLEANKNFIQGLSGPADLQRAANKLEEFALRGENQAMHALQVLMTGISEGISFVLMLFEERVADIFTRLDDNSRMALRALTYEGLFAQNDGKTLAKHVVKAIVNRNIESGSNVETVADALRRRCGSFCSADDVVIFKAQEQLKRASEQNLNPTASRTLLYESIRLFEKVAASLTRANLEGAVEQYIHLRYYAGAIQLCLSVAQEKDRGNKALYWMNDGKPAGDPRASAFEERRLCYELIHHILMNLDNAVANEPETIDGKRTLIATKRDEAYAVVNESPDEVFHLDLYKWYVRQGFTDRLLSIESPHVITYLQRLASTDANHAELLCRFYTIRQRYYEAAKVQADLAKSSFPLSIKERLQLLSQAKVNVNVLTVGVGRQELQMLNHEVSELLEVAHIQDDLLERLKADSRIVLERKIAIENALDGPIQGLSELFNEYADAAGYHDLCLLIFAVADFRNPTTILQTWQRLIQQIHDEATSDNEAYEEARRNRNADVEAPAQPAERLITVIQDIRHRIGGDMFIFPVNMLLPEICRYAIQYTQGGHMGPVSTWPVDLFMNLGVSHDAITRVLEGMFERQEVPFRGPARVKVVEWILHAVKSWTREALRSGRTTGLEQRVSDLLGECEAFLATRQHVNDGGVDVADMVRELREVRRDVEGSVGVGPRSSFGASLGFL